jgi:phosphoglycolate phosphatase
MSYVLVLAAKCHSEGKCMGNEMPLVLFDIDCTLLLTGGAGREATQLAMEEVFGASFNLTNHVFGGKTDWQTLHELLADQGYDEARVGAVMAQYSLAVERHLSAIIGNYPVKALPGAIDTVRALYAQGVPMGIVTGNVSTTAPVKLRAAGYDMAWFPVGAFGSEARSRDHLPPMAVERAAAHFGRTFAPENVIVVGDTPADVECARALGAVAVGVRTGFCKPGEMEAAAPDILLDDLTGFLDVFETLRANS